MDDTVENPNSINITRIFPASKDKLFELWTNPALIKTWLTPKLTSEEATITAVDVNLRIDGRFKIVIEEPEGIQYVANGTYKKIVKPNTLVFTWHWSSSDSKSQDTLVSINYKNTNEGCKFNLLHESFDSGASRDTQEQGWNKCLDFLDSLIQ